MLSPHPTPAIPKTQVQLCFNYSKGVYSCRIYDPRKTLGQKGAGSKADVWKYWGIWRSQPLGTGRLAAPGALNPADSSLGHWMWQNHPKRRFLRASRRWCIFVPGYRHYVNVNRRAINWLTDEYKLACMITWLIPIVNQQSPRRIESDEMRLNILLMSLTGFEVVMWHLISMWFCLLFCHMGRNNDEEWGKSACG